MTPIILNLADEEKTIAINRYAIRSYLEEGTGAAVDIRGFGFVKVLNSWDDIDAQMSRVR